MAVCIYLDWIVGGPVNVICIGHSSDRMIGLTHPANNLVTAMLVWKHLEQVKRQRQRKGQIKVQRQGQRQRQSDRMIGLTHPANNLVTAMLVWKHLEQAKSKRQIQIQRQTQTQRQRQTQIQIQIQIQRIRKSNRMIGPLPPCRQSCYRHVCVKQLKNWQ